VPSAPSIGTRASPLASSAIRPAGRACLCARVLSPSPPTATYFLISEEDQGFFRDKED